MSYTLWFMGRPAAGKSTLAKQTEKVLRKKGMSLQNLDGDEIREQLNPDLGFTRQDRALNNRRTAFICRLLNENGISVVNAMITPFQESQRKAREIIEPEGNFVLIYVRCSVKECERRDPKNLYEQAQNGEIKNFTGVNHPFEEPQDPDITVDTEENDVDECLNQILRQLENLELLEEELDSDYDFDIIESEEQDIKERLRDLGYLNK